MTQPRRPYGHLKNGDGATEVNVDVALHECHHGYTSRDLNRLPNIIEIKQYPETNKWNQVEEKQTRIHRLTTNTCKIKWVFK
jgi:hypothetical protein